MPFSILRGRAHVDWHPHTHPHVCWRQTQELSHKRIYFIWLFFFLQCIMFQVCTGLSKLISEIFRAPLETGCCSLRADGDRMMLWLTCLSSLHLLLLTTVWLKCIAFNLWRCALILNSSQFQILEPSWESARLTMFWMWKYIPPAAAAQPWWCIGSRRGSVILVSRELNTLPPLLFEIFILQRFKKKVWRLGREEIDSF